MLRSIKQSQIDSRIREERKNTKKLSFILNDLSLKPREKLFIAYYVEGHWNGTQAYIKAGYKAKTEAVAGNCASELLRRPYIVEALRTYVQSVLGPLKESLYKQITDVWLIRAFYDPGMFYKPDGSIAFTEWDEIPMAYRHCIDSMEVKYYGREANKKIILLKLADKNEALDKLDKYIQLTKDTKIVETTEIPLEKKKKLAEMFESNPKKETA